MRVLELYIQREVSSREGSCSEEAENCLTISRNGLCCEPDSLENASEEKMRDDKIS